MLRAVQADLLLLQVDETIERCVHQRLIPVREPSPESRGDGADPGNPGPKGMVPDIVREMGDLQGLDRQRFRRRGHSEQDEMHFPVVRIRNPFAVQMDKSAGAEQVFRPSALHGEGHTFDFREVSVLEQGNGNRFMDQDFQQKGGLPLFREGFQPGESLRILGEPIVPLLPEGHDAMPDGRIDPFRPIDQPLPRPDAVEQGMVAYEKWACHRLCGTVLITNLRKKAKCEPVARRPA